MKCLKNLKTGTIIRLDDFKANNMIGKECTFTSKVARPHAGLTTRAQSRRSRGQACYRGPGQT